MAKDLAPRGLADEAFAALTWDQSGLITVVVQDHASGEVLMVAHADLAALKHTLTTGQATFFSRSRGKQWIKGESSGHSQRVIEVRTDCDGDCLLYRVEAHGPACHQNRRSCFSTRIDHDGSLHCDRPVIG
jgi:phosphoribosyl-AMP cyclohydrolase